MKTFIIFCWFIFSWALLSAQQRNTVDTDVSGVTLYSDRAEVTRSVEMTLYAGDYELTVKDLPYALQDQSLRVGGSGTASARITDIKIETDYIDTLPKNKLKDLQEQLALLLSEEKIYTDRLSLLTKEKELLDLIKLNVTSQGNKDKETPKPTFEDWNKLFVFYDANSEKMNDEMRSLEKKKNDLNVRKSNLQSQINQLSGYSRLTRKRIHLSVSVSKPGTMNFDITYVISGARWYPLYDVRVSPDDKSVEFVYYAMISQTTGEDWKNVNLAISTARPNISGAMPQLSAWYLNVYTPYLGSMDASGSAMSNLMGAGAGEAKPLKLRSAKKSDKVVYEEEEKEEAMPLEVQNASVETKTTSVVFKVGKRATIPSDNFDHKVSISVESLKSQFAYSSTPKLAELAYLRATIENSTDVPFLAGNANVFFGNNFVGTTRINTIIPTEKFDAFLGIDEGIRVKREQVRDYRTEKGLFSKSTKKSFEYRITIESFKKTEDTISIQDQWPISQDERIKVETVLPEFEKDKTTAAHPNGVIEKKGNGVVEWRLKIKPKEKIELRIKYNVECPKDIQIDGL
jgi:uncharacterized protein (TIGR02231 family)